MNTGNRDAAYSAYYERNKNNPFPKKEIVIEAKDGKAGKDSTDNEPLYTLVDYPGQEQCLEWINNRGTFTYDFEVEEAGNYSMEFFYYTLSGGSTTIDVGIRIDGEYPFTACNDITLDRYWEDASEIRKDSKDNELKPTQKEKDMWVTYPVKDKEGLFNYPYFFYLSKGKHTLTLEGIRTNLALKTVTFKNYDELPDYVAPSQSDIQNTPALSTGKNDIGSNTILIQAERPVYKTASTLYPTYDRTSSYASPSHPTKQRYNTIGADTWNKAAQAITWSFTVPTDGYYNFSFKARQNKMRGFYSNRRIYIDGVVPNKDMDIVSFPYDPNWYAQRLKDHNGDDMYLFLEAGEHTITLEVVPGDIGEIMRRLDDLVYQLNYYYRRILMITGPSPDEYNDYLVDRQIPELIDVFKNAIDTLYNEKANIEKLGQGSEASSLQALAVILQRCVDKVDDIPQMVGTLKDYISAVSAWMRDYRDQPLEFDYIEVLTVHEQPGNPRGNFFEEFAFGFQAFIGSFFEDYTMLSDTSEKSLNVWVSLGRDQATVVKDLVDNDFNQGNTGVQASINLVQGAILEATLAGKGPDIALFLGGDFPIQCAARGLLVDVSEFRDYEDVVKERFTDSITTLYTYNGGVYGLPVSQTFPMMFYRTDILEELGIGEEKIPKTWDQLIEIIPILQRSYLTVGLVQPTSNLSSSIFESGDTFSMLVLQTGNNIYVDDLSKTTFDKKEVVDVFKKWTDFYTIYDFEQTYDPFTRFRTGEMPIIINNYPFFNQLTVSAPEIKGLWDFTHVPGTPAEVDIYGNPVNEDDINYAANSSSAGAVIFTKCVDKNAAWEFIKWFTSDDVMTTYGRTIEGQMGQMGRFDTANKNALAQLPWSNSEYEKISDAMSQTVEIPIIPASYATTRHVKNAFRAVVNDAWNPRYSLSSYNRDINAEITRKNEDLALISK
ncbi:MAG: extracellular solute-binding protein [Ruminiclostridium sp.]|nr:extracellular solute-binding protein [Ruminiclostridium sp.]